MKAILTSMVLASASAFAQQATPEPTLKAGSDVKLEAVTSANWVQGEPLKAFEPGKIYMFECWATWCGPCIAAIPHVNELHKKYFDKGLRIYGMNVWEDGQDKVEKFVKAKGDGMSYPVAYTGKGSVFENDWLKAAGVRGIPHAFIVKDGKLLFTTHPSQMTESVIEALLSGDEGVKKAADEINAAKASQEKLTTLMQDFRKATVANDADAMAATIAELEKSDANSPYLGSMKLDLLIAKKDWPAAAKALEEMPEGQGRQMSITMIASRIAMRSDADYPADFIKSVTKSFTTMISDPKSPANAFSYVTLTSLQWKGGDKDAALASARKSVEVAKAPPAGSMPANSQKIPVEPFERFAKAVEGGSLPTTQDISGWLRESMGNNAVPAGKVKAPAAKE